MPSLRFLLSASALPLLASYFYGTPAWFSKTATSMAATELAVAPHEKIEPAFLYVSAEAGSQVSEEELNGIRGFRACYESSEAQLRVHRLVRQRACTVETRTVGASQSISEPS